MLFFRLVQIHDPAENPKSLTCHQGSTDKEHVLLYAENSQFELEFVLANLVTVPNKEAVNAAIQNVEAGRFTRLSWSLRSSSSAPERLTSAEIDIADLA